MWTKITGTIAGSPIIIDQYENEVVVFIDYPNQNLVLFRNEYPAPEDAIKAHKDLTQTYERLKIAA